MTCPDCGYVYDGGRSMARICARCAETDFASPTPPRWFVRLMTLLHMKSSSKSIH